MGTDDDRHAGTNHPEDSEFRHQQVVLITGCSSGIGHATAQQFLDEGWTVYATARDPSEIDDLAAEGCETAQLDVTDPEQATDVVEAIIADRGRIDCLVNNAGIGQRGTIEDIPPRKVRKQFDVNVFGPHRLIRTVLPYMRDAATGSIINVSSFYGRLSTPGMGVYAGSKMALEGFSDALRGEVRDLGIDVVIVEPGMVTTNFEARTRNELADVEQSPAYSDIYEFYDDAGRVTDAIAVTPETVAETIVDAAETSSPDHRYTVGPIARLLVLARHVPHPIRDRVYRLLLRLT